MHESQVHVQFICQSRGKHGKIVCASCYCGPYQSPDIPDAKPSKCAVNVSPLPTADHRNFLVLGLKIPIFLSKNCNELLSVAVLLDHVKARIVYTTTRATTVKPIMSERKYCPSS